MAALSLSCFVWAFSISGEWGYSSCDTQASHCSDFSCCRTNILGFVGFRSCDSWALEHRLNSWAQWLSCSAACGIFQDRTHVSCPGRLILYHWATREAEEAFFDCQVHPQSSLSTWGITGQSRAHWGLRFSQAESSSDRVGPQSMPLDLALSLLDKSWCVYNPLTFPPRGDSPELPCWLSG